jgi:beta-N-acetylhexosaminidase
LRRWVGRGHRPALEVVGSDEHQALARELAGRSITLVRDDGDLLPLRLRPDESIAAIMPEPSDLTPADTSARLGGGLAGALRAHHPRVDEFVVGQRPSVADISDLRERARDYAVLVVGTIFASVQSEQADLVRALLATGVPVVVVALRTPHDLVAFPDAPTYLCTYSVLGPSMTALADALWARASIQGHLPAGIGTLYPRGHGLTR